MVTTPSSTDFCIVGGGLVGALLALLLAERSYSVVLFERRRAPRPQATAPLDTRALALNFGSIQLLKNWGLAALLDSAEWLSKIHVSDKGHRGFVHINAATENLPYLGAVIPFETLVYTLQEKVLAHPGIRFIEGEYTDTPIESTILIGADGADSSIRKMLGIETIQHDYHASALIGKVRVAKQVADCAFERFTAQGPIALLPAGDCLYTLVWVKQNTGLGAISPTLLAELQQAFGFRAGIFIEHGVIKKYPLKRTLSKETYRGHAGLLGNAAHTLHPVAGQGFNLALRDILTFLEVLDMQTHLDASLWPAYEKRAQLQQKTMQWITHAFVKGFEKHNPLVVTGRNLLLSLFEINGFARSELNNVMIGKY